MKGYALKRATDFKKMNEIKEKFCYVSKDLNLEKNISSETNFLLKTYELPDNMKINIEKERYEAPEILFKPHLFGLSSYGLSDKIFDVLYHKKNENHVLNCNLLIVGGTSLLPGLSSRIETDLKEIFCLRSLKGKKEELFKKFRVKIEDPTDRKYSVYKGTSIYSEMINNNPLFWVEKKEYEEMGVRAFEKLNF